MNHILKSVRVLLEHFGVFLKFLTCYQIQRVYIFPGCLVFLWNTLVWEVGTGAICLKNYTVLLGGEAAWKGRHLPMILTIADGPCFMYMRGKVILKGYVYFSVVFLLSLSHSLSTEYFICVSL